MDARTEASLPTGRLLGAGALLRLGAGLIGIVAFLVAMLFADGIGFWNSGVLWVVIFTVKAGWEAYHPSSSSRAAYLSPTFDIILLTAWLAALTGLYGQTAAATLKAPGFVFYFPLILGAALWLRPLPVLVAGAVACLSWVGLVCLALAGETGTTISYTHYLRSFDLMPFVELEKLLALGTFTVLLAFLTRHAQALEAVLPLEVPMVSPSSAQMESGSAPTKLGAAATLSVFAAEDNGVNRLVLEKMLDERGFDIIAFEDGDQLTRSFKVAHEEEQLPGIVLLDLDMPIMGGVEAAQWIRSYEEAQGLARTPILAVTAQSDDVSKAVCAKAGMDGHLAKPVTRETLFSAMLAATLSARSSKSS